MQIFLIKNERAGDDIALKLPRRKRRKEQHKARAKMREKCTERTAKKEQAKEPSMIRKGTSSPVHRREVNGWRKGEETEGSRGGGGRGGAEKNAG